MDEVQTGASGPVEGPKNDVSQTVIVMLVILTLTISIIGTWTVLTELSGVTPTKTPKSTSGQVQLYIQDPNGNIKTTGTTGYVALEIQ